MSHQSPEVPTGYQKLAPFFFVPKAERAIQFYERAFGARERFHVAAPDGRSLYSLIEIGEALVMLTDVLETAPGRDPTELGGVTSSFFIFVADVDTAFAHAIAQGASIVRPVATLLFGERVGTLRDPFGHCWMLSTHVEDVSPGEMQRRADEALSKQSAPKA
jgi:PhnB protein